MSMKSCMRRMPVLKLWRSVATVPFCIAGGMKMNVQRHLSICQVCFAWCAKVPCQLSEAHCTCAKAPCRLSEAHCTCAKAPCRLSEAYCTCAKAPCRLSEAHCKLLVSAKSLADSQTALFVTLPYGESSISAYI